jgi:hypothetical protein
VPISYRFVLCVELHLSLFSFHPLDIIKLNASLRETSDKMADFDYVNRAEVAESKGRPPPLDFHYHYSRVTAARLQSSVKSFYKYFQIPGIGNLAGGMFALLLSEHFEEHPQYTEGTRRYLS